MVNNSLNTFSVADLVQSYTGSHLLNIELETGRRAGGRIWNNIGLGFLKTETGKRTEAKNYFKKAEQEIVYLGIGKQIGKVGVFAAAIKDDFVKSGYYSSVFHSL